MLRYYKGSNRYIYLAIGIFLILLAILIMKLVPPFKEEEWANFSTYAYVISVMVLFTFGGILVLFTSLDFMAEKVLGQPKPQVKDEMEVHIDNKVKTTMYNFLIMMVFVALIGAEGWYEPFFFKSENSVAAIAFILIVKLIERSLKKVYLRDLLQS